MVGDVIWLVECTKYVHVVDDISTWPFFGICTVIYIDDVLFYSKDRTRCIQHLKWVLEALQSNELKLNIKKCEFVSNKLAFLLFIVGEK